MEHAGVALCSRATARARLGPRVPGWHAHRRPARGTAARQARRRACASIRCAASATSWCGRERRRRDPGLLLAGIVVVVAAGVRAQGRLGGSGHVGCARRVLASSCVRRGRGRYPARCARPGHGARRAAALSSPQELAPRSATRCARARSRHRHRGGDPGALPLDAGDVGLLPHWQTAGVLYSGQSATRPARWAARSRASVVATTVRPAQRAQLTRAIVNELRRATWRRQLARRRDPQPACCPAWAVKQPASDRAMRSATRSGRRLAAMRRSWLGARGRTQV